MNRINDQLGFKGSILPDIYIAPSLGYLIENEHKIYWPHWKFKNSISGIGDQYEVLIVLFNSNLDYIGDGKFKVYNQISELSINQIEESEMHPDSDSLETISRCIGRYKHIYLLLSPLRNNIELFTDLYGANKRIPTYSKSWEFSIADNPFLIPKPAFAYGEIDMNVQSTLQVPTFFKA